MDSTPVFPDDPAILQTQGCFSHNPETYKQFVINTLHNVWAKATNNIEEAHARQKAQYDKKVKPVQYHEQDLIYAYHTSNSGRRKQKAVPIMAWSVPCHLGQRTKFSNKANYQKRCKRSYHSLQSG